MGECKYYNKKPRMQCADTANGNRIVHNYRQHAFVIIIEQICVARGSDEHSIRKVWHSERTANGLILCRKEC